MGTSNWQQIPFCIEALMKIAPSRVLDVGVGFGRWGMITREFCDVWFSRVFREDWKVHLEGIEAFPRSITDYHQAFYNKIHLGDAAAILPDLPGPWSVIIFGDVLEHFTPEVARHLLTISLERADYVLVNIPIGEEYPQGEAYGNVYERHLSTWTVPDFAPFSLVRHFVAKDLQGRDYGSFVLSRRDPQGLRHGLFSRYSDFDAPTGTDTDAARILSRLREQAYELSFIKNSSTYRTATALRSNPLLAAARRLARRPEHELTIRPAGPAPGHDAARQTWIMGVHNSDAEPGIPWDFIAQGEGWTREASDLCPYGACIRSDSSEARVRTGPDPVLRLMRHRWGGLCEVRFGDRRETLNLYRDTPDELVVRPARSPMVSPEPQAAPHASNGVAHASVIAEVKPVTLPLSRTQVALIDAVQAQPGTVAVHCPCWLGVSSSTRTLFAHTLHIPESLNRYPGDLSPDEIDQAARALAESHAPHVVFSGGDEAHLRVAERLHTLRPDLPIDMLWHGSYVQLHEEYVWHILKLWMNAVKAGTVRSICTVKAGMEDFFRALGIPSALLLNDVPGEVLPPPEIPGHELHAGMWLSGDGYRKLPYAMLAALKLVPNARLHAAGLSERPRDVIQTLGIPVGELHADPLPQERLHEAIRRTHVSLYVTFSECTPMLPLESLRLGVPCLVGPTSHLFEHNPFLAERLIVPQPDRADTIARYLVRAAAERHEIIAEYRRDAEAYHELARASVDALTRRGPSLTLGDSPLAQPSMA